MIILWTNRWAGLARHNESSYSSPSQYYSVTMAQTLHILEKSGQSWNLKPQNFEYNTPSNIIHTPTLDFFDNVKICRPMYNTHPPYQHPRGQSIGQKRRRAYVIDRMMPSGSRLENGFGRWVSIVAVTNVWPLIATSLKPSCAPPRCPPSVTVWRSVHTSPFPIYHVCGGRTRGGRGGQTRPVRCCNTN